MNETAQKLRDVIAAASYSDGHFTFDWNGRTYRVRTETDEGSSINDYDSDGRVAFIDEHRDRFRDNPAPRPAGFNGAAVKLRGRDWSAWWQPCPDAVYPTREGFLEDKQRITDLIEYGFVVAFVEWLEGTDAYGNPIVKDYTTLGGLEWDHFSNAEWSADTVAEMVEELESRTARERLEYLRQELRAERISYGELAELQTLAQYIDPGDVELLEAAGVPER